jgi:hypothetical protein
VILFGNTCRLYHRKEKPSSQVVQFGLESILALEELNSMLNAQSQLGDTVNIDGPAFGGVFGANKPVFEIFGFKIHFPIRLQATGQPNCLQISETAFQLISVLDSNLKYKISLFELPCFCRLFRELSSTVHHLLHSMLLGEPHWMV